MSKISKLIVDLFLINLLWFLYSIPIITVGPATVAMYTCVRKLKENDKEKIVKGFNSIFFNNLKIGIIVDLILAIGLIFSAVWFNHRIIIMRVRVNEVISLCFLLQVIWISIYIFYLLSRLEMSIFGYLKTAYFLSIRHFPSSLVLMTILMALYYVVFALPPLGLFVMGIYGVISYKIIERVMAKYLEHPTAAY